MRLTQRIGLYLSAAMIISCAGVPEPPATEESPEAVYDESGKAYAYIDSLLEEGRSAEALQLISIRREIHPGEESSLRELEDKAWTALSVDLDKALEERDYPRAFSRKASLDVAGRSASYGEGAARMGIDYLKNLLDFEKSGAAAALVTRGFTDLSSLEDENLKALEQGFLKGENRRALSLVSAELSRRGEAAAADTRAFLERPVTMEDLLEGTVTVWVDKGLKIEKGVGMPDRSIGSGFFIDKKGYLLTNYHVISSEVDPEYRGFSKLYIKLSDDRGEKIPARVVGWDRHFDIALLKTEIEASYVFSFASDDRFELGEKIFAIGSPGGLNNTITSGTVSALRRPMQTMGETVQVDVPINPGNSGGPLMNSDSEVTGIVFAGIEEFEGVNFAIDGSYVKKLLPALYEGGAIAHPWMGIGGYQGYDGIETLYIMPDSPADRAGLKRGDKILAVNGIPVKRNQDVRDLLLGAAPGTLVRLDWEGEEGAKSDLLALAERPDIPLAEAAEADVKENLIPPLFGMIISRTAKNQYAVDKVYTGGGADDAGISANDVILLRKWLVNEKDGYVLIQFFFKGVKAGYLESAVQLGVSLESTIFF